MNSDIKTLTITSLLPLYLSVTFPNAYTKDASYHEYKRYNVSLVRYIIHGARVTLCTGVRLAHLPTYTDALIRLVMIAVALGLPFISKYCPSQVSLQVGGSFTFAL